MIEYEIDRATLSRFFGQDNRTLIAFENIQRSASQVGAAADAASTAQVTADASAAAAAAAQSAADTIAAAAFVVLAASGALSAERVLTGDTGVSLDVATAGLVKIAVNALAILNAAPVVLTQPVDVQAALQCDSLRIDAAPTATATASTHSIPISISGVTYYMRLSATP